MPKTVPARYAYLIPPEQNVRVQETGHSHRLESRSHYLPIRAQLLDLLELRRVILSNVPTRFERDVVDL